MGQEDNRFYDGVDGGNFATAQRAALATADRLAAEHGEAVAVYFGRPDHRIACWFVRRVSEPTPYSAYFQSPMRPSWTVYPNGTVRPHGW